MFGRNIDHPEFSPELKLQIRVSRMLGMGFVLSITSIFGVGSLIAVILGLKANRIIRESDGIIAQSPLTWWCIVVGALGAAIFLPLTLIMMLGQLR